MDEYYISKEDWDTVVELGVGDYTQDTTLKKIPSATKAALTRKYVIPLVSSRTFHTHLTCSRYNSSEHPIPFHKATELGLKPTRKIAKGEVPDQEDVIELDDVEEEAEEAPTEDVTRDKFIKGKTQSKTKPKIKAKIQ